MAAFAPPSPGSIRSNPSIAVEPAKIIKETSDRPLPPLPNSPLNPPNPLVSPDVNGSNLAQRRISRASDPIKKQRSSYDKPLLPTVRDPRSPGPLLSPAPEPLPNDILLRGFHILRLLCISMDATSPGAHLTAHIHISPAIWQINQPNRLPPPKIPGQEIKLRVLETLSLHLDIIRKVGQKLLHGQRDYRPGQIIVEINQLEMVETAHQLILALDAMEDDMQSSYKALVKLGLPVHMWKGKKKTNAS